MVTVLVVYRKAEPNRGGEVVEYLPVDEQRYSTRERFLEAVTSGYRRLYEKYGMPNSALGLFEGTTSGSLDGFFASFREFDLTESAIRSDPGS